MPESTAWAVATQQAHASGNSPKGYGTSKGRKSAKAKYDAPKKDYVQTAKPKTAGIIGYAGDAVSAIGRKITNADTIESLTNRVAQQEAQMGKLRTTLGATALVGGGAGGAALAMNHHNKQPEADQYKFASAVDGYSLAVFAGFSSEMQKIAGRLGEAAKSFGHYIAGGPKADLAQEVTHEIPRGFLGKAFGMKPKHVSQTVVTPGAGPRVGMSLDAISNPATRPEALKVLGARGAVGAGALGVGSAVSKEHKEHTNERLGRAYMAGARDMYAKNQGY